jgi:hypothetical protein
MNENKKYFMGHEISEYGVKHNRVDYRTLAKSFDAVLCNDIAKLFYSTINDEYNEAEQCNGYDYYYVNDEGNILLPSEYDELEPERQNEYSEQYEDIYQYYIVSEYGADILQDYTDEIVYYLPAVNMYVWGVTHFGTGWDCVLTNIKIEEDDK